MARERERGRIREREQAGEGLERFGGAFFVRLKNQIVELGCARAPELITQGRAAWDAWAMATDIPYLPNFAEVRLEKAIGDRLEAGARAFVAKVCPVTAGPTAGSPGEEVFRSPAELMGNPEVMALANDPTLPPA